MGYTIQSLDDLPVVLITIDEEFGGRPEMNAFIAEIRQHYDQLTAPVYQVVDMSRLSLDFDDVLALAQIGVKNENNVLNHRNNLGVLLVTTSRFYQMAAKGLNTATFGHVNLPIYASVEAALKWVRDQSVSGTNQTAS